MEKGKKRLAVLVGCNYPNTPIELKGCINDVESMKELLIEQFGFDPYHVVVLTDEPGSGLLSTGANIKAALNRMISIAEPGDVLFFYFSGYGTWFPSPMDPSKLDEAIVPCDFNLVTDEDFTKLVNRLPTGASFTILSDSSHTGGLVDKENAQIEPSSATQPSKHHNHNHKVISNESLLAHLASLTNLEGSDLGAHLTTLFGSNASPKFQIGSNKIDMLSSAYSDSGILLSGCQPNGSSADLAPTSTDQAHGAFTLALCTLFKAYPGPLSNKQVVMLARQMLNEEMGIEQQHPCLYSSDQNINAPFLWQPDED